MLKLNSIRVHLVHGIGIELKMELEFYGIELEEIELKFKSKSFVWQNKIIDMELNLKN